MAQRVIHLHPDAPPKPPVGAACNGCGVCCASSPCPLGLLLSRRTHGACAALRWDGTRYACGALATAGRLSWAQRLRRRLVARWIAAGRGCDSAVEVQAATAPAAAARPRTRA